MMGLDASFEELEFVFANMKTRKSKREVHFDFEDMDIDTTDEEYQPQSPQRSTKKQIVESSRHGFGASGLYAHMKHDTVDVLGRETMKFLSNHIYLHKCEDGKRFYYHLYIGSTSTTFTITVLKGSLYTYAWSAEARYDECILLEVVHNSACYVLWALEGVNPDTMQLLQFEQDWTAWNEVHARLSKISPEIASVGVHCFAMTVSKILLHLPIMEKYQEFMEPMPANLMYRDMCQQSFPCLLRGFSQHDLYHSDVQQLRSLTVQADGSGIKLADFSPLLPNIPTLIITELVRHAKGHEHVLVLLNAISHDGSILRYVCVKWLPLLQYLSDPSMSNHVPDMQLLNETDWYAITGGEDADIEFEVTSSWGHDCMITATPTLQKTPPLIPHYTPSAVTSQSRSTAVWRAGDIIYVPLLMFGFKMLTEEDIMRNSNTPPLYWYVKGKVVKKHKKMVELYFECFDARIQKHSKFLEHDCKSVLDSNDRLLSHREAEALMISQGVPISHVKGDLISEVH